MRVLLGDVNIWVLVFSYVFIYFYFCSLFEAVFVVLIMKRFETATENASSLISDEFVT